MSEKASWIDGMAPPRDERESANTDALASKLTSLAAHLLLRRELGLPIVITDEALGVMRDAASELEGAR